MFRLITSADRRLAAISKVVRVRVEFSKNRLNTLLPRSSGTFFTSRSLTLTKLAGGVEDVRDDRRAAGPRSSAGACSSPLLVELRVALVEHQRRAFDVEAEAAVVVARERQRLRRRGSATRAAA